MALKRFTNPHTTPDPNDPVIRKLRRDFAERFGHDPLEEPVDFEAYVRELRDKYSTPEYQREAELARQEDAERLAREKRLHYERQLERLSWLHVAAVKGGCDPRLRPLTTTALQRQVMEQWDGAQSMFLLGETAIGKTYTATWCAMRAAARGAAVAGTTALRVSQAGPDQLVSLRSVDLLVLDQLHTLRSPSGKDAPAWQVAPVVDLIDLRYERRLTTIAAGTRGPDAMIEILGADAKRRFPLRLTAASGELRREPPPPEPHNGGDR